MYKVFRKSLFHISMIKNDIFKLNQKCKKQAEIFEQIFGEIQFIDLIKNVIEYNDCIVFSNRQKRAEKFVDNIFIDEDFFCFYNAIYLKIGNGYYVEVCSYNVELDILQGCYSEEFFNYMKRLAVLYKKIGQISERYEVQEMFSDISFKIKGFLKECLIKNKSLYDNNGDFLAKENNVYGNFKEYCRQYQGYLDDDYSGYLYYEVSPGLFVEVEYSC